MRRPSMCSKRTKKSPIGKYVSYSRRAPQNPAEYNPAAVEKRRGCENARSAQQRKARCEEGGGGSLPSCGGVHRRGARERREFRERVIPSRGSCSMFNTSEASELQEKRRASSLRFVKRANTHRGTTSDSWTKFVIRSPISTGMKQHKKHHFSNWARRLHTN